MPNHIIKRAHVQLANVELQKPSGIPDAGVHRITKKRAVVVEHDGRPIAIEVTCSCGEITLVELDFESPGKNAEKSS